MLWLVGAILVQGHAPDASGSTPQADSGQGDGTTVVPPGSLAVQPLNVPFRDPAWGTLIRRVSDESASGGYGTHIYSQLQAFSPDNAYLLLIESGSYVVRRHDDLTRVALDTSGWNAPRWYPGVAHSIVHYDSNADTTVRVQVTDVDSLATTTLFTFPQHYDRVRHNQSFDELSDDGRWMGGMLARDDGVSVIVALDLVARQIGAVLPLADLYAGACVPDPTWGEVEPDWIGMSPLGTALVVQWARDGTSRCSGLESFDPRSGQFLGRVYDGHAHGDLGVMPDGITEFFMTFELYHPSGSLAIGVRELPGEATASAPRYLRTMDWHGAHISCRGPAGVCVITTSGDPSDGWSALEGEVFLQYTDGSIRRLAHHRSSSCGYWVQPRASVSRDGRYVAFASDWQPSGTGSCDSASALGRGEAYVIDLGASQTDRPTLTVAKAGSGSGVVTSSPAGITCGDTCSAQFAKGATVTLTATASSGATFTGFGGHDDCVDGVVTMASGIACSATFGAAGGPSPPGPPPPTPGPTSGAGVFPYRPAPLDLDGDARGDVIDYDPVNGGATIRSDGGTDDAMYRSLAAPAALAGWSPGWHIEPGDFDGDGRTDLLFYDERSGAWIKGISDGSFGFSTTGGTWSPGWSVGIVELDGDGRDDVFLYDPASGSWYGGRSRGDGRGGFEFVGGRWSPGWQVHPVRLNADELTDLFLYDQSTGAWYRATNDGDGGFSFRGGSWSPGWQVTPGDYDGDSLTDLFLYDAASGHWYLATNNGADSTLIPGSFSPAWSVRAGDFSGEGRTDLFLYNLSTGEWFESLSDGAGNWSHVGGAWSPGWNVRVTSFNLDGLADVLLYDPATGHYYQGINRGPGRFDYVGGTWPPGRTIIATSP